MSRKIKYSIFIGICLGALLAVVLVRPVFRESTITDLAFKIVDDVKQYKLAFTKPGCRPDTLLPFKNRSDFVIAKELILCGTDSQQNRVSQYTILKRILENQRKVVSECNSLDKEKEYTPFFTPDTTVAEVCEVFNRPEETL